MKKVIKKKTVKKRQVRPGIKKVSRKRVKRKAPRRLSGRPPISALKVRFLGLNCDNIIDADRFSGLRTPMAGIVEKYPQLKEAFERGQFLRMLKRSAEDGNPIEEIAEQSGFSSVAKFKEAVKNDYEARSIWNSMRKDRIRKSEDRRQRTENRGQRTEDRGQRTEDRRQKTEDRRQRKEDRRQRSKVKK